jgi:hypothetical protein
MLISIAGCKTATSYPQFNFGDFESRNSMDFLTNPSFSYLRCGDCAFIPQMRAINHEEYAVDFCIYSDNADSLVTLDQIEIMHNETRILSVPLDCPVSWEKTEEDTLLGSIRVITIPMGSVEVKDGDLIQINLSISVTEDNTSIHTVLSFEGSIWQYTTVVFPV